MKKKNAYKVGDVVYWKWMGKKIEGTVLEIHDRPVVKEIKGKKIKRNGSAEVPAYYVQSAAGNKALKLQSEVFGLDLEDSKTKKAKPRMFS